MENSKYQIPVLFRSIWQHGHLTGAFDSGGYFSLVMIAKTCFFPWLDFKKTGNKTGEQFSVFIVHVINIFLAEVAEHRFRFMI